MTVTTWTRRPPVDTNVLTYLSPRNPGRRPFCAVL